MRSQLHKITAAAAILSLAAVATPALAYIGPGSGISVIGSLLGLLATVLIAVGAIALFPFRRMLKKKNEEQAAAPVAEPAQAQETQPVAAVEEVDVEAR